MYISNLSLRIFFALCILVNSAFAEITKIPHTWNKYDNPSKLKFPVEYNFFKLPKEASVDDGTGIGWSGSYWPSEKGGIANRWNHPFPNDFKYESPTYFQLKNMSPYQIAQLSPAEKLDILNGDYNYTLKKRVLKTTKKSKSKDWAGICHGWAIAALNFVEPQPVSVTNKDGITIEFGASDVKGLLSHYMAYGHRASVTQIGGRCFGRLRSFGKCNGLNPASFHITLANTIGLQKKGFIADVDRFKEVWNQPVLSYKFEYLDQISPSEKEMNKGIARFIKVRAYMTYADELQKVPGAADDDFEDHKLWTPVTGTIHNEKTTKIYDYLLELNSQGKILGGIWLSADRPDFLWIKGSPNGFNRGTYSKLKEIYKPIDL